VTSRESKRCPDCGQVKKRDEWVKNRSTADGLGSYCKPCHNTRIKAIALRLYGGHDSFLLKLRYGISRPDVESMVQRQNGKCAVCKKRPARHVDHDHRSGKVRGMLCFSCNRGLGKFDDDPAVIAQALEYLQKDRSIGS
jgi:NMD protein affecting ribosome stability and mRNA decay